MSDQIHGLAGLLKAEGVLKLTEQGNCLVPEPVRITRKTEKSLAPSGIEATVPPSHYSDRDVPAPFLIRGWATA